MNTLRDFEVDSLHPYNEICGACGYRKGEHFSSRCDPEIPSRTLFTGTGVFSMERGEPHWRLLAKHGRHSANPNFAFKALKR